MRKQAKQSDIRNFYEAFRQRLKKDENEDISDLHYAINSADMISKELAKHNFNNLVTDKKDAKLAKDLALEINKDVNKLRKRYSLLKNLLK